MASFETRIDKPINFFSGHVESIWLSIKHAIRVQL